MKELEKLIKESSNKSRTSIGPLLNRIKKDKKLKSDAEELTEFLNAQYENVSLGQRIYHLWFNSGIERCSYCDNNKKFSNYQRFSPDRIKKDSNYYNYCESIECLIEDFKKKDLHGQGYGSVIAKISNEPNYREQLLEKTEFLNSHYDDISDSQRFYHIFFNEKKLEKCEFCDSVKSYTFAKKFSQDRDKKDSNYCKTCGSEKCCKKAISKYSKIGILEKYGVSNIWDIPGYRDNFENSNLEKFGSKYYTGTEDFREKTNDKFEKNWGGHPTKHKSVQDKIKETNLKKYGYEHRLKNPIEYEKATKKSFQYRDCILPSGKKVRIQGYENFAIDTLLKTYNENDLIIGNTRIAELTGIIKYDNNRTYFPDIFIQSERKIIEVKSHYTYRIKLKENLLKKEAVLNRGLLFEFWIFDSAKNLMVI